MMKRIQAFDGTQDESVRTSIVVAALLVGLMILDSVTPAMAWGSKGHRIIGLIAQELLSPETSAGIETIMGTADLATFGLYLDDNKDRLEQQIPGSRAWHYDNIPICGSKPHSECATGTGLERTPCCATLPRSVGLVEW